MCRLAVSILLILCGMSPLAGQEPTTLETPHFPTLSEALLWSDLPAYEMGTITVSLTSQAFFCRTEHQVEKRTGVPLRFRLGDQDAADYWEGKARFRGVINPGQRGPSPRSDEH